MVSISEKMRLAAEIEGDPRWAVVVGRSGADDFVYSVASSGIYCRPGCAARLPRPENVRFHAMAAAAEAAGFRPCKRCKPDGPSSQSRLASVVAAACRAMEADDVDCSLRALAGRAGFSPSYFHHAFRRIVGVTPKAYATELRARRMRHEVARGETVTDAIYAAGFSSSGRFYENATEVLGMTPTNYRAGGVDATIRFTVGQCALGAILVATSDKGICAITLGDDADALCRDLQSRFPHAELIGADPDLDAVVAKVVAFVEQPAIGLGLPLDIRGTAFQRRVWEALQAIPAGEVASYADVAASIGAPNAVRAVAGACAANHLAVAIPCHRVVRADGSLSGYRWGVARKRELLRRESLNEPEER